MKKYKAAVLRLVKPYWDFILYFVQALRPQVYEVKKE